GPLQLPALAQTLREIGRRHETLRTTFDLVAGQPVQVIAAPGDPPLTVVDLSSTPVAEREAQVQSWLDAEPQRCFDLTTGPLWRVTLLRQAEDDHVALLVIHHIIADAWSVGVLLRELAVLYQAHVTGQAASLPEPVIQYADFAAWQRQWLAGEVLQRQLDY